MNQHNRHELFQLNRQRGFSVLSRLFFVLAVAAGTSFYFQPSSNAADKGRGESKHGKKGRHDDKPSAVSVETTSKADFPVYLNGLGTVTALRTVTENCSTIIVFKDIWI